MPLEQEYEVEDPCFTLLDAFVDDPRPTLVVDTQRKSSSRGVQLELANNAFTSHYGVLLRFITSGQILEPDFIAWLKNPSSTQHEYFLGELRWTSHVVKHKYKIVTVTPVRNSSGRRSDGHNAKDGLELPEDATRTDSNAVSDRGSAGSTLTVALPSGLVSLGSAPTALEGLHRSVDMSDVGFFEYDLEGSLIFANKSWYSLSGHPYSPESHAEKRFLDLCYPDDIQTVTDAWQGLVEGKSITFEMRWRHMGSPSAQTLGAQWIQAACIPLYDDAGNVTSISGITTDINTQKLSETMALSRAEALEKARTYEARFEKFAAVAPISIFNFGVDRKMTFCNNRWFELTSTQKQQLDSIDIGEGFYEEDVVKLFSLVSESVKNREVNTIEMRLKKTWHASDGRKAQAWVLASIFAEFTAENVYSGCTGTLVDISEFKYADNMQKTRLEDAIEAKRQQENFIDMTSHEMRNPLSAMVQCADSSLSAVAELATLISTEDTTDDVFAPDIVTRSRLLAEVELALDGLKTIVSCCAHQKCIIDDVLTLSKLDSNLVNITPVPVEPVQIMLEVLKMFEIDALNADVELTMSLDSSIEQHKIEWLMLDPSRIKQILINLLSNAIKFTRNEKTRRVVVKMSATTDQPSRRSDIKFAPASRSVPDGFLSAADWGSGELVYLQFAVQDTGRGLTANELQKLFHRFSQASPKTHIKYGGSGLGLFITRQLTELQGGEVGVASLREVGSTFTFYVQTRRTSAPENLDGPISPKLAGLSQVSSAQSGKDHAEALPIRRDPIRSRVTSASTTSSRKASPKNSMTNLHKPLAISDTPRAQSPASGHHEAQPNVLLVEDNMVNQKVLSTQLKRLGCSVSIANHGLECLDYLRSTEIWQEGDMDLSDEVAREHLRNTAEPGKVNPAIDVILMDIEMPMMGGLACTHTIRELERQNILQFSRVYEGSQPAVWHQLPIISISANAREEQGQQQRDAGVDDIITKPFRIPQLMDKICRLTGKGRRASLSNVLK